MYSDLSVETDPSGVVTVLLNRPEKLNAFRLQTLQELERLFSQDLMQKLSEVKVVIIGASGGKAFSSGLDLTCPAVGAIFNPDTNTSPGTRADYLYATIRAMQCPLLAIANFPRPVICAVNGLCLGLGVDLACACDIRVASTSSTFSVREVKIGICADLGSLFFLPKICANESWVRKICFTGNMFSAAEALSNGFVSDVVEGDSLVFAKQLGKEVGENATVAVGGTKENLGFPSRTAMHAALDHAALWNSIKLQETAVIAEAVAKIMTASSMSRL